jgi:hypothetical protein
MDPQLKDWVLPTSSNPFAAKCRYCPAKVINVSSMGRTALKSHAEGQKHKAAISAQAAKRVQARMDQYVSQQPETEMETIAQAASTESFSS